MTKVDLPEPGEPTQMIISNGLSFVSVNSSPALPPSILERALPGGLLIFSSALTYFFSSIDRPSIRSGKLFFSFFFLTSSVAVSSPACLIVRFLNLDFGSNVSTIDKLITLIIA